MENGNKLLKSYLYKRRLSKIRFGEGLCLMYTYVYVQNGNFGHTYVFHDHVENDLFLLACFYCMLMKCIFGVFSLTEFGQFFYIGTLVHWYMCVLMIDFL